MTWTTLNFSFGAVLTSSQMNQLYANFQGYANSDAGSPNVVINQSSATSDITLGINQVAVYDIAGGSSISLHIATSDSQVYDLSFFSTVDDVTSNSQATTLYPNNNPDTNNFYYQRMAAAGGVVAANGTIASALVVGFGNLRSWRGRVGTGVASAVKHGLFHASTVNGGATEEQLNLSAWSHTGSTWNTLGALVCNRNVTGRLTVQRIA